MAVRSGVGVTIGGISSHGGLFGEAPSRVIVCVATGEVDDVRRLAGEAGVAIGQLGVAGGDRIVIDGIVDVDVADAIEASAHRPTPIARYRRRVSGGGGQLRSPGSPGRRGRWAAAGGGGPVGPAGAGGPVGPAADRLGRRWQPVGPGIGSGLRLRALGWADVPIAPAVSVSIARAVG